MNFGILAVTTFAAATAMAAPPAEPPVGPVEPAIELRLTGDVYRYTYDLTTVFDDGMWKVLEDNGFSEILIQVNLVDGKDQLRISQHHQLKVDLLAGGAVRLTSGPKQEEVYPSRAAMLKALKAVKGKPIAATEFPSDQGYLDMLVLVNPVKVFDFPDGGTDGVAVGERTVYDRKLEVRSAALIP
jgi:hypothetical protein